MTTRNIIEGLQILEKYYEKPSYNCGAEHDVIYAYATDAPVAPQDIKALIKLGWAQEVDCGDDDFADKHYDPEESWTAYV